ncbi:nestin [Sardina pilchardus]|uniref:nestin n=1 Tax=Sardina pilchardus TaxID=27697 RepID=UPI002E138EEE
MEIPIGVRSPQSYTCLGQEKHQMLDLNRRLESYLGRVQYLEMENHVLREEIQTLRSGQEPRAQQRRALEAALQEAREELQRAWTEKDKLDVQMGNLSEELQAVERRRRKVAGERAEAQGRLAESRRALEEERRAQIWLRDAAARLENELHFQTQVHQEDVSAAEASLAQPRPSQLAPAHAHGNTPSVCDLGLEYSQKAAQAWREASEAYERQAGRLEESLGQAKARLSHITQERRENQMKLQSLTKDLEAARAKKDMLERRVTHQSDRQSQEIIQLQVHVEALEEEKTSLGAQIDDLIMESRTLLQLKMSLGLEVATYRTLLDGENQRVNDPSRNKHAIQTVFCTDGFPSPQELKQTLPKTTFSSHTSKPSTSVMRSSLQPKPLLTSSTHLSTPNCIRSAALDHSPAAQEEQECRAEDWSTLNTATEGLNGKDSVDHFRPEEVCEEVRYAAAFSAASATPNTLPMEESFERDMTEETTGVKDREVVSDSLVADDSIMCDEMVHSTMAVYNSGVLQDFSAQRVDMHNTTPATELSTVDACDTEGEMTDDFSEWIQSQPEQEPQLTWAEKDPTTNVERTMRAEKQTDVSGPERMNTATEYGDFDVMDDSTELITEGFDRGETISNGFTDPEENNCFFDPERETNMSQALSVENMADESEQINALECKAQETKNVFEEGQANDLLQQEKEMQEEKVEEELRSFEDEKDTMFTDSKIMEGDMEEKCRDTEQYQPTERGFEEDVVSIPHHNFTMDSEVDPLLTHDEQEQTSHSEEHPDLHDGCHEREEVEKEEDFSERENVEEKEDCSEKEDVEEKEDFSEKEEVEEEKDFSEKEEVEEEKDFSEREEVEEEKDFSERGEKDGEELDDSPNVSMSWKTDPGELDSYALDNTLADTRPLIRYKSDDTDVNTQASHMGVSDSSDSEDERQAGAEYRGVTKSKRFDTMEDLSEEPEGEVMGEVGINEPPPATNALSENHYMALQEEYGDANYDSTIVAPIMKLDEEKTEMGEDHSRGDVIEADEALQNFEVTGREDEEKQEEIDLMHKEQAEDTQANTLPEDFPEDTMERLLDMQPQTEQFLKEEVVIETFSQGETTDDLPKPEDPITQSSAFVEPLALTENIFCTSHEAAAFSTKPSEDIFTEEITESLVDIPSETEQFLKKDIVTETVSQAETADLPKPEDPKTQSSAFVEPFALTGNTFCTSHEAAEFETKPSEGSFTEKTMESLVDMLPQTEQFLKEEVVTEIVSQGETTDDLPTHSSPYFEPLALTQNIFGALHDAGEFETKPSEGRFTEKGPIYNSMDKTDEEHCQELSMLTHADATNNLSLSSEPASRLGSQPQATHSDVDDDDEEKEDESHSSEEESPNASQCPSPGAFAKPPKADLTLEEASGNLSGAPFEAFGDDSLGVPECFTEQGHPHEDEWEVLNISSKSQGADNPTESESFNPLEENDSPFAGAYSKQTAECVNIFQNGKVDEPPKSNGKDNLHSFFSTNMEEDFWGSTQQMSAPFDPEDAKQEQHHSVTFQTSQHLRFEEAWGSPKDHQDVDESAEKSTLLSSMPLFGMEEGHSQIKAVLGRGGEQVAATQSDDSVDEGDSWSSGEE